MDDEEMGDDSLQGHLKARLGSRAFGNAPRSMEHHLPPNMTSDSDALLGQFSFAPATQTTVVTTTTTTTTKFPPFRMRQPRRLQDLDPNQYPLADSPTPASLRKIQFEIGGKQTIFNEIEDTALALEQFQEEQQTLRSVNGTIETVEIFRPYSDVLNDGSDNTTLQRRRPRRPASPESITDNEEHVQSHAGPFPSHRPVPSARHHRRPLPSSSRFQVGNPITPESAPKSSKDARKRAAREASDPSRGLTSLLPSPSIDQQATFQSVPTLSPRLSHQHRTVQDDEVPSPVHPSQLSRTTRRDPSHDTAVPTPPIDEEAELSLAGTLSRRALSSVPARLHVAESPSALDGSLPSPSLSPVTAAATLQSAGYFADIDSNSEIASQHEGTSRNALIRRHSPSSFPSSLTIGSHSQHEDLQPSRFSSGSVAEIPALFDYFEVMPDEMKSYVMHQLLRRCSKPTLQVIADAVNPALKCDFLAILPPELALSILKYLDLKSLSKAAQVSKKWRQIINSDERAWKELFEADGFVPAEGELQQAINEGWGWQDPFGPYGHEQNLSYATRSETEANASSPSATHSQSRYNGILRRSKRKASTIFSARSKQLKCKNESREGSADVTAVDWLSQMSSAEGPYNAANAAVMAVPHPNAGLPSLKGLHLYKSLYRRHYLIRRNWMLEETKPQHLAFRAHDTHVVTCLQFDTDKILTGSDDNNINVYETKTGILRAILTGHEGGVWALQYEGNTLVSGSTDRSVRVWNIAEARETQVFRGHTSTVRCLQIVSPVKVGENAEGKPIMMPKQPLIITGSRDSTLRVWKLPRPEDPVFIQAENEADTDDCPYFVRTLTGHQFSVRAIAAHADTLVSGSYDCTVRVWRISTGETVHRLTGHTAKVYSVVLDHERNRCISGSMDNMVRIWDLNTGSLKYTLEGHTSLVGLLDLNCDKLVSAAADSTLRIWDPETGQCKATLSAHTGAITCFKHDGQKVISGSDRTLKLWNIKTGECIKDLLSDLSGVWQVKFNERRCVAAVQRDGLTYIEVSNSDLKSN